MFSGRCESLADIRQGFHALESTFRFLFRCLPQPEWYRRGSVLAEAVQFPGTGQVVLQSIAEFFLCLDVHGGPGHVHLLTGILAHFLELFGRPFAAGQVVKSIETGFVLFVHEQCPGGGRTHFTTADVTGAAPVILLRLLNGAVQNNGQTRFL